MKRFSLALAALAASTAAANAGGIDRGRIGYGILYEEGNRVELGFSTVSPSVSGAYPVLLGGGATGNMAGSYSTFSLAYKHQFSDQLSFALIFNTPYGADANYTAGAYTGLAANWTSNQITGILRYEVTPAISVYGGLRYLESSANIAIPAALVKAPYTASGSTADVGYLVGAAYEKPEIALRVALTYESAITHRFPTTETWAALGPASPLASTTEIEMPQSIALDFQSGVAKDTLVFGSIRWTEWSAWEVRPPGYSGATGEAITGFDNDVMTYQLGVGRRLNENFSVFARVTYEEANGGVASRLAPTDGSTSFGLGGTFTKDNVKITGGIEYAKLGNAIDGSDVAFSGNDALGVGVSISFGF